MPRFNIKHSLNLKSPSVWLIAGLLMYWILAIGWVRIEESPPAFSEVQFYWPEFDAEAMGLALQELFFPLILLFILRETRFLNSLILSATEKDISPVFSFLPCRNLLIFTGLQLLVLSLTFTMHYLVGTEGRINNGVLLVIIFALCQRWPSGLFIGLATALLLAGYDYLLLPVEDREQGISEVLLWHLLLNFEAMSAITAGLLAGLIGPALLFSPLRLFLLGLCCEWLAPWMDFLAISESDDLTTHFSVALITGLILAIFGLIAQQVQGQWAQARLESAEQARLRAELTSLRTQINPHFLFNSLTSVLYFIRTDADKAYRLLSHLSELFRGILKARDFISLDDELYLVSAYVELEQARLGERLMFKQNVPADISLEQKVPALILQPLVENAIVHGITPLPEGGTVTLDIIRDDKDIMITILDTGSGQGNPQSRGSGIAWQNIQQRMVALFGEAYCPQRTRTDDHKTCVTVRIPV